MKIFTRSELVNLPYVKKEQGKLLVYKTMMVCPSDEFIDQYPAFYLIGCNSEMKPIEIIGFIEGFRFDSILSPAETTIIFHMVGDGVFQFWAKKHQFTINLLGQNIDIRMIKK